MELKIRNNSNFCIVVSKEIAKNVVLLNGLKTQLESCGYDMSNVSFGFYDKQLSESDLVKCPCKRILVFSNIAKKVVQDKDRIIQFMPILETYALSTDLQSEVKNSILK